MLCCHCFLLSVFLRWYFALIFSWLKVIGLIICSWSQHDFWQCCCFNPLSVSIKLLLLLDVCISGNLITICLLCSESRYGMGSETPMHPSRTPLHPFMTPMRDPGGWFCFACSYTLCPFSADTLFDFYEMVLGWSGTFIYDRKEPFRLSWSLQVFSLDSVSVNQSYFCSDTYSWWYEDTNAWQGMATYESSKVLFYIVLLVANSFSYILWLNFIGSWI